MIAAARLTLASACLAAVALAGCATPRVQPKISQAVLDARAHRNAPPQAACPDAPLASLSPLTVGFPFNDSELTDSIRQPMEEPARWMACHPATPVVILPDADGHGAGAEQDALAARRAAAVRDYLVSRGVPAERLRVLRRGQAEPVGEIFLVRAEGRRW